MSHSFAVSLDGKGSLEQAFETQAIKPKRDQTQRQRGRLHELADSDSNKYVGGQSTYLTGTPGFNSDSDPISGWSGRLKPTSLFKQQQQLVWSLQRSDTSHRRRYRSPADRTVECCL